ncbi:MAG: hypothetical protein AAF318_03470 [Pseudomonadota bacterium]
MRRAASQNLLRCGGFAPGADLLVVAEDPSHGWYEPGLAQDFADDARAEGFFPTLITTTAIDRGEDAALDAAIAEAGNIVFFARVGDRARFSAATGPRIVMVYATERALYASPYGTLDHADLARLKDAIDAATFAARDISITCPLGTHLRGAIDEGVPPADVTVRRFPLGVPAPIPAATFSGTVRLAHALAPTGSRVYAPATLPLPSPLTVALAGGRWRAAGGDPALTRAMGEHYAAVAGRFAIDGAIVHSFHAGFHPGAGTHRPAADDYDRWANTVFMSARFLHFHTCGAYAPGEICWMIKDPTINLDGAAVWRGGTFDLDAHPTIAAAASPALRAAFSAPNRVVGL